VPLVDAAQRRPIRGPSVDAARSSSYIIADNPQNLALMPMLQGQGGVAVLEYGALQKSGGKLRNQFRIRADCDHLDLSHCRSAIKGDESDHVAFLWVGPTRALYPPFARRGQLATNRLWQRPALAGR
jgi:hypothetical protein